MRCGLHSSGQSHGSRHAFERQMEYSTLWAHIAMTVTLANCERALSPASILFVEVPSPNLISCAYDSGHGKLPVDGHESAR